MQKSSIAFWKMHTTLSESPRYTKFVSDRDQALERIQQNTQIDLSRILYTALENVDRLASQLALRANGPLATVMQLAKQFDAGSIEIFSHVLPLILDRISYMRRAVFILTYASEQEAIGRATQKRPPIVSKAEFKQKIAKAASRPTFEGPLDKRLWMALMKLRHRISQAFMTALMAEKSPQEIVAAVKASFPKPQVYKRPPKALTKVREAGTGLPGKSYFAFDFIDDADWDLAVEAYKDTELPPNRFDNLAQWDPEKGMMAYAWEGEQEATEDFVKQVRDGQVDAATDLGVKEFVWVAILDDKTCEECCVPRNGKTTSEIEQMDDDCDATVPPAHFNCRCQISPVASTDEVQGPDWQSFNDWIES